MRALYWKGLLVLAGVSSVVYAVNNSYIGFYGPYQVTQYAVGVDPPWEPATAVGPYWVHAFENGNLYTAVWNNNGGGWTVSNGLVGSGTEGILSVGDGFLAYDAYRTRYVIVGTDFDLYRSSAYFGASTDGITWPALSEVLSGPANGPYHPQNVQGDAAFDYASVAVDNSNPRRIIVGAVLYQSKPSTTQCLGYYINISLDGGSTWSGPTQVAAPNGPGPAPLRWGINARVVAAGNQFFVFLPELAAGSEFQPLAVYYYAETSTGWTLNGPIIDFSLHPPLNNTPSGELPTPVYYAPLIDASGSDSGTWAVSFQARTGGSYQYNNVYECSGTATTSNGCWAVNAWPVDQFMNGVNVDWMGGVWVSYLGFSANYQYKLLHQVQYFPPGGVCGSYAWCGTTGDSNVDPRSWTLDSQADRCGSSCYAMGDYARIGSNGGNPTDSSLGISAPYVNFSSAAKQLFQVFYYDPPGTMSRNSFVPNAIYYPPGTTLPGPSTPNPPETLGIAPELRRKPPGFNHM